MSADVIVAGGGPGGATTALLLARAGVNTLLLDPSLGLRTRKIGETLPPVANGLLVRLGLWESFRKQHHLPSDGIASVWGTAEPRVNDFFSSLNGVEYLFSDSISSARDVINRGNY